MKRYQFFGCFYLDLTLNKGVALQNTKLNKKGLASFKTNKKKRKLTLEFLMKFPNLNIDPNKTNTTKLYCFSVTL